MEHTANSFTLLKKHNSNMESSFNGNMVEVHQLCQNNDSQTHYLTYEVLDKDGHNIGGRLIYEFKDPNQALTEWDQFINEGLKPNAGFTVTKQELPINVNRIPRPGF